MITELVKKRQRHIPFTRVHHSIAAATLLPMVTATQSIIMVNNTCIHKAKQTKAKKDGSVVILLHHKTKGKTESQVGGKDQLSINTEYTRS